MVYEKWIEQQIAEGVSPIVIDWDSIPREEWCILDKDSITKMLLDADYLPDVETVYRVSLYLRQVYAEGGTANGKYVRLQNEVFAKTKPVSSDALHIVTTIVKRQYKWKGRRVEVSAFHPNLYKVTVDGKFAGYFKLPEKTLITLDRYLRF